MQGKYVQVRPVRADMLLLVNNFGSLDFQQIHRLMIQHIMQTHQQCYSGMSMKTIRNRVSARRTSEGELCGLTVAC